MKTHLWNSIESRTVCGKARSEIRNCTNARELADCKDCLTAAPMAEGPAPVAAEAVALALQFADDRRGSTIPIARQINVLADEVRRLEARLMSANKALSARLRPQGARARREAVDLCRAVEKWIRADDNAGGTFYDPACGDPERRCTGAEYIARAAKEDVRAIILATLEEGRAREAHEGEAQAAEAPGPVKVKCDFCLGHGGTPSGGGTCPICVGTGWVWSAPEVVRIAGGLDLEGAKRFVAERGWVPKSYFLALVAEVEKRAPAAAPEALDLLSEIIDGEEAVKRLRETAEYVVNVADAECIRECAGTYESLLQDLRARRLRGGAA